MDRDSIRNIIGILGNIISFLLFLSPLQTFVRICKKKDVEAYSPNPYLAMVFNCALWVFYGLPFIHPNSLLVITINSFGLFCGLVYCSIYLTYANNTLKRVHVLSVLAVAIGFVAGVAAIALKLLHTTQKRSMFVGIVCVIFNILMYGMPLDIVRMVIRTKSVVYMPFSLLLANFVNGGVWLAYSLLRFDLFILISNVCGCALGLLQLTIYAWYYKTTPKHGQGAENRNEIEVSENERVGVESV